ncbi:MAG TPA: aldo/keto reductase [Anaeromyxobacteraceae bacterium]|jgi:aryl-alcohol dehydrogenase-like predicted oxidoreductase
MTPSITRRQLLAKAGATASGLALLGAARPGQARAGEPARPGAAGRPPPAAAAGRIVLGGDMPVHRMGFGAMRITGPGIWGEPKDPAEARRLLRRAVELGVNLLDTADAYGPEVSERIIREALHPYPGDLVVATKGGLTRPAPERWDRDGRPAHLRKACEASLRRLRLERIDLYQLHAPDPDVPLEDSMGELARLRREGKIRHVGVSNFDAAQLRLARGIVEVVSVQNRYNAGDRRSDDVLQICSGAGIAFMPWAPLATREPQVSGKLARLARSRGITPAQAALAWLLARSPVMLPIPGTSSIAHLEENVAAAAVRLTPEELAAIG